jgi:hypothetical protein
MGKAFDFKIPKMLEKEMAEADAAYESGDMLMFQGVWLDVIESSAKQYLINGAFTKPQFDMIMARYGM